MAISDEVLSRIDLAEVVDLALELGNIDSPTGSEGPAAEYVYEWLEHHGFEPKRHGATPDRFNVSATIGGSGGGYGLIFNGHLDTTLRPDASWSAQDPLDPLYRGAWLDQDEIIGDGVVNDKGPIAAFLVSAKAIRDSGVQLKGDLTLTEALPHIEELLQGARAASIPVVHVTGGIEGVPPWREMRRLKVEGAEGKDDPATRNRRRRMYDIMEPVTPIEGEPRILKSSPSAFWGTPLEALLNSYAADTLIVAGESTSGCVRATVVDARSYRYNVIIAEECVFDRHESSHAMSLFDMDQKYAEVLRLAEVLAQFKELPGRQ